MLRPSGTRTKPVRRRCTIMSVSSCRMPGQRTNFFEMTHAIAELESEAEPPTRDDREIETRLATWFRGHGSVLVGFSGGVDSAYLACIAVDVLGRERVLAVIGRS